MFPPPLNLKLPSLNWPRIAGFCVPSLSLINWIVAVFAEPIFVFVVIAKSVWPLSLWICKSYSGVEVPIPTFPPDSTVNKLLIPEPNNSITFPAPDWTREKKVFADEVELATSFLKNCALFIPSNLSASNAAGTEPKIFLGDISPS